MPCCASEGCKGVRVTHAAFAAHWQSRDAKGGLYAPVISRVFPASASLASRFPDFAPLKVIAALYGQAVVVDEDLCKPSAVLSLSKISIHSAFLTVTENHSEMLCP